MKVKTKNETIDIEIFKESGKGNDKDFYEIIAYNEQKDVLGFVNFSVGDKSIIYGYSANTIWMWLIQTNENYQHSGIGQTLLNMMEYVAVITGYTRIEGKYYPKNEFAKPFYLKNNYKIDIDDYDQFIIKDIEKKDVQFIKTRTQAQLCSPFEIKDISEKANYDKKIEPSTLEL